MVTIDSWEVEVAAGFKAVVARGPAVADPDTAFNDGLLHAQRGLDLISARNYNNLLIRRFDDDYLVWWSDRDGLTVRQVCVALYQFDVPPAQGIVHDKDGNVVPQAVPPDAEWHESFRYFRLSQTSDDLFDAYRNAYLALESILSSIAPQPTNAAGRVSEREGDWFLRALTQANQLVALSPLCPPSTTDPIQYLWDEFYRDMRSAMSHAKSGRSVLLPQDNQQRLAVTESLQRLIRVYLALADSHLGLRRPGGGIFAVFFRRLAEPVLNVASAYATDDESDPSATDTIANPAGGVLHELIPTGPAVALAPFVVARTWFSLAQDINPEMTSIRRIVAAHGGVPLMAAIPAATRQHDNTM